MYTGILIFTFILLNIPLLILVPIQNKRLRRIDKLNRIDGLSVFVMGCSIYMIYRVVFFDFSFYPDVILMLGYGIVYLILSIYWFMKIWNSKNKSGINN
jgi:phosphatidylserine synthase